MAITRQKKEEILKELQDKLGRAKFIAFINFHGISVALAQDLRRKLRAAGASYDVIKKTLVKKATEGQSYEGLLPEMEGELAIVISEADPLAPAKILIDFSKKNKILKVMGGMFENKYVGSETVVMLGNIPPKEVLYAQFVNVINSPIQGLVVALNQIASKKS